MDEQLDSKEFADAYDSALKRAARVAKENRHDISLAEDAAQEAVLKLLVRKKRDKIRSWFAFLHTSVRREVVKFIRKSEQSLEKVPNLPISQVNSADQIYNGILIGELERQLPEKELEIVRLYEFHGLDFKEIGVRKKISAEAARKRYYRGIKTIRENLEERAKDGK